MFHQRERGGGPRVRAGLARGSGGENIFKRLTHGFWPTVIILPFVRKFLRAKSLYLDDFAPVDTVSERSEPIVKLTFWGR